MRSDQQDDDDRTLSGPHGAAPGSGPARQPGDEPTLGHVGGDDPTLMPAKPAAGKAAPGAGATPSAGEPKRAGAAPGGGAAQPSAATPQLFAGRFEVVELLGEGGMGKVYSVRDRQIEGRAVALKVLLPKFSKNEKFRSLFFQEIRAAQNFVSENVVQVRDCGQMDDGRLFVTMDLVAGEPLRELTTREGVLRPRHALEIARQTLLALQSGHERGFVHRDVKPANIMLAARVPKTDDNPHGVGVRVLDFGIAGLAADIDDGRMAGTPMYMSPEQVQGQRLDARSDLFAVGVVLYEMLAGRRPFGGTSVAEITQSVIETNVTPLIAELKELSAPIRKILEKALQKDREKRFQSAAEFITAIEKSSAYRLPSAVPGWAWAALVVLGGAAAAEGFVLTSGGTRTQQMQDERDGARQELAAAREEKSRLTSDHVKLVGGLNTQLNEIRSSLAARDKELADLKNQKVETGSKEGDVAVRLQSQIDLANSRIESLELARQKAEREKELEAQAKVLAQQRIEQLEDKIRQGDREREKLQQQLNPAVQKSARFDALLDMLARGSGAQAAQVYDDALRNRVFLPPARAGTDLIAELIGAAAALEKFESSRRPGAQLDVTSLLDAGGRLGTVRELRAGFVVDSNDWLGFGVEGESAQPRLARLDDVVAQLTSRVQPEIDKLGDYHADDWAALALGGPEQDPAQAVAHARTFRCEHLAELMHDCVAAAANSIEPGGRLDLAALASARHLDAWGAYFAADPAALANADARELVLLGYARRWYDRDDANDAGFDFGRLALPQVTAESADWRVVLALEYQLAQPGSCYPIVPGRSLVFRFDNNLPLRWRVDELASEPASARGPWDLKRSQYRDDAMPLGTPLVVRVVRRGAVFSLDGSNEPLLDLKACGDSVRVAPLPQLYDQALPPQLPVGPDSIAEHRAALAQDAGVCLVYKRGAITRWVSPKFGLVRESSVANQASSSFELVFATPIH